MSKYKLIISPFAEEDLQISYYWYSIQKEGLGDELIIEIENILKIIKRNPTQFPIIRKKIHKALVPRFPFVIYFYVTPEIINVFAIFHSGINPKNWKTRVHK